MKLEPTTFIGAFRDGLVELSGHQFECRGRIWVVHQARPPYNEFDATYLISDKESGMNISKLFQGSSNRQDTARRGKHAILSVSEEMFSRVIANGMAIRATLTKVEEA